MAPSDMTLICVAVDSISWRLGAIHYDRYLGPEGDYLRLVGARIALGGHFGFLLRPSGGAVLGAGLSGW